MHLGGNKTPHCKRAPQCRGLILLRNLWNLLEICSMRAELQPTGEHSLVVNVRTVSCRKWRTRWGEATFATMGSSMSFSLAYIRDNVWQSHDRVNQGTGLSAALSDAVVLAGTSRWPVRALCVRSRNRRVDCRWSRWGRLWCSECASRTFSYDTLKGRGASFQAIQHWLNAHSTKVFSVYLKVEMVGPVI